MSDSEIKGQGPIQASPSRDDPSVTADGLDQLLMDCVELEGRIASMSALLDGLSLAIGVGEVTAEHAATLAGRVEFVERELIDIANQINQTATAVVRYRRTRALVH